MENIIYFHNSQRKYQLPDGIKEKIADVGTLVFNQGEAHSRKLIPSYRNSKFVCRDNPNKIFDIKRNET